MSTTFATASKCPKCNNTGEPIRKQRNPVNPEYTDYTMQCQNALCLWFGTNWAVMVDDEGKVPERDIGHVKKSFPELPKISDVQRARLRTEFDDEVEEE